MNGRLGLGSRGAVWRLTSRVIGLAAISTAFLGIGGQQAQAAWDISVAGFGGYSMPFKTNLSQKSPIVDVTHKDAELENSAVFGGKITAYTTATRRRFFGLDLGAEIDITRFSPSLKQQVLDTTGTAFNGIPINTRQGVSAADTTATIVAVNFLARKPFGVTKEMPMGRWYPYVGVGGGIQMTSTSSRGFSDSDKSPVIQVPAGVTVFLTRHIALFGEYKYTRASHTFTLGPVTSELSVASNNFVGGLAIHFN